jgi:hypothetical protein
MEAIIHDEVPRQGSEFENKPAGATLSHPLPRGGEPCLSPGDDSILSEAFGDVYAEVISLSKGGVAFR